MNDFEPRSADTSAAAPAGDVSATQAVRSRAIGDGASSRRLGVDALVAVHLTDHDGARPGVTTGDARFRALFENSHFGVAIVDLQGFILDANAAFADLLHRARDEIVGLNWAIFTDSDDLPACARELHRIIQRRASSSSLRVRFLTPDGTLVHASVGAVVVDERGAPGHLVVLVQDVTEHHAAEAELRQTVWVLRQLDAERARLLRRVVTVQEEERRRTAAELHDDAVQCLAVTVRYLDELAAELSGDAGAKAGRARAGARETLASLRSALFRLHPAAVERVPLHEAYRRLLEKTSEDQPDLRVSLDFRLPDDPPLATRLGAFRILQEALANVRRHAEATEVSVLVREQMEGVLVRVADDGRGFDPAEAAGEPDHVGLITMRERAQMLGGWSRLYSMPGAGTEVEFWLPYAGPDEAGRPRELASSG